MGQRSGQCFMKKLTRAMYTGLSFCQIRYRSRMSPFFLFSRSGLQNLYSPVRIWMAPRIVLWDSTSGVSRGADFLLLPSIRPLSLKLAKICSIWSEILPPLSFLKYQIVHHLLFRSFQVHSCIKVLETLDPVRQRNRPVRQTRAFSFLQIRNTARRTCRQTRHRTG